MADRRRGGPPPLAPPPVVLVPGGEVSGYGAAASNVVTTVARGRIACGTATYTGDIVSGRAVQSNYNNSLSRGRETFGGVHASGPHDVVEDINGGKSPSRDGETFSGVHAHGPHDVFEEIKGGKGLSKGRQTFSGVHAQPHDVEEDAQAQAVGGVDEGFEVVGRAAVAAPRRAADEPVEVPVAAAQQTG